MMTIKQKLYMFPVAALFMLFVMVAPVSAATSADQMDAAVKQQCSGLSADAADRCATRVREEIIQAEIQERCGSMSADAADRCATSTRQSIAAGDYNYNGVPDSQDAQGSANFEGDCKVNPGEAVTKDNCGIVAYVVTITRVLSGLVGVVVVLMIAIGGIQYATSRDDPAQVKAAKTRIQNAILALVFYMFALAFIQWLVPGGVF